MQPTPQSEPPRGQIINRVVTTKRLEPHVLGTLGALVTALAAYFAWQELHLGAEVLLVVGMVAVAAAAWLLKRANKLLVGPVAMVVGTFVAGGWYFATREPMVLVALAVGFVVSVALAWWERAKPSGESSDEKWHRLITWHGLATSGLVTSLASYFFIFDASDFELQHFIVRRAALTMAWLCIGVVGVLYGRSKGAPEIRDAGFLSIAAAVGKILIYDTSHLDGGLRIGLLALSGALLLVSAVAAQRINRTEG